MSSGSILPSISLFAGPLPMRSFCDFSRSAIKRSIDVLLGQRILVVQQWKAGCQKHLIQKERDGVPYFFAEAEQRGGRHFETGKNLYIFLMPRMRMIMTDASATPSA
ncbi:hypothetical protein M7I_2456 [Glarea lozoyensis 74030]|uniref:Uncharacterized protein n=1 Tax=Glarea lozoyensis (strain ATCC 74030 / MF5533) TaxID=1104152 RepID=H0EIU0_GLAL7|nr:hypothetical protein M7I_2456 [Glarea lozoyensis 74030]